MNKKLVTVGKAVLSTVMVSSFACQCSQQTSMHRKQK